jgi:6-hydroxycyclohex-1-ene-1-carbonyl-CoA dehydrogenase
VSGSLGAEDDVVIELEAVQGSAAMGRVVEAGERATSLIGQRVLVGPIDPCGECDVCRRGGAAVCPLARRRTEMPSRLVARGRWVVPLGDGLDIAAPHGAAVAGDVALAYTLYGRTGAAPREPLVVVGAAPVTRFLVEILLAKGLIPVVVADLAHTAWCEWLRGKGVALAPGTSADEVRPPIVAVFTAQGLGTKPWRVIATSADSIGLGAALAGPRATLTVLAPVSALPGDLAAREVTVIGVAGAHPDLVVEVAAMCVKGEIDLIAGTAPAPNTELRAVVESR